MNRINFKNIGGEKFHHLNPYPKKEKSVPIKERIIKPIRRNFTLEDQISDFLSEPLRQVKKMTDIKVIRNPQGYKHNKGFAGNHIHLAIRLNDSELGISDSIGGCGMQQLYGWLSVNNVDIGVKLIERYLEEIKHTGVGLIICQLGQDYYGKSFEKALIQCGFTVLIEYSNYTHCRRGHYKQKIYKLERTLDDLK